MILPPSLGMLFKEHSQCEAGNELSREKLAYHIFVVVTVCTVCSQFTSLKWQQLLIVSFDTYGLY